MGRFWMVRAGTTGRMAGRFERLGFVGIEAGPEAGLDNGTEVRPEARPELRPETRPDAGPEGRRRSWLFNLAMAVGDDVATYDPSRDEYIVGRITGPPVPNRGRIPGFTLLRSAVWEGRVSQTLLGAEARAALAEAEILFEPGAEALAELRRVRAGST
jgi:predicted Mrr-cat superfamily restriction endonuclease